MGIEIRKASPGHPDHEAVKRLRYAVFAAEEGLELTGIDAETRSFADELDEFSLILGAFDADEAVASIRMTPVDALPAGSDQRELFGTARFPVPESRMFVIGRLIVDASRRGSPVFARLLAAIYQHALQAGFEVGLLLCRPRELPMYESVGCRVYRNPFGHEQYGLLVPMAHLLRDLEHAKRVPSPIVAASAVVHNEPLSSWFGRAFGAVSGPCSVRLMGSAEALELARALANSGCPPFGGFSTSDLEWVLKSSARLEVPAGTRIVPRGSRGSELYVLLSGEVVVTPGAGSGAATLLHAGQVFAENGFLWKGAQASGHEVTALGRVSLLSLSARAFGVPRFARPEVAANFFLGLSQALSEKLQAMLGARRRPAAYAAVSARSGLARQAAFRPSRPVSPVWQRRRGGPRREGAGERGRRHK